MFSEAVIRFSRKPNVDIRRLGFPARWRAGGLLVVKADLNREEQTRSLNSLCNQMIVIDRELQQAGKAYLDDKGLTALFEEAMPLRSSDAFQADFVDLAILHCLLEIAKPRQILELGSGLSTIVLGNAARENGGQVISLEPNADWAEHTTRCMPARLRANVSVRHTGSAAAKLGGRQTNAFEFQPEGIPEFIYLNGAPPVRASMVWRRSCRCKTICCRAR